MHHAPGPQDHQLDADLRVIRREVDAFRRTHRLRWSDEDDLFQECLLRWLPAAASYDQARATRTTFLKRVVRSQLQDVWKAEQAGARRGHSRAMSLDEPLGGEDGRTLGDAVPSHAPDPDRAAAWNVSLARIIERLSERQRAVVKRVLDGYSMVEVARELGVHRDTLYQDLKRIREVFWQEGLAPPAFDPTDRPGRSYRASSRLR